MEIVEDRFASLAAAVTGLEERVRRTPVATGDDRVAAAETCRELQRFVVQFAAQAGAASATGLAHAAEWLSANLEYLVQQQRPLLPEERAQVFGWPSLVSEYLRGQSPVKTAALRLVQFAELQLWHLRPSPVGSANILTRLQAYQSPERAVQAAPKPTVVQPSGPPHHETPQAVAAVTLVVEEPAALASEPASEALLLGDDAPQTAVDVPAEDAQSQQNEVAALPQDSLDAKLAALIEAAGELAGADVVQRAPALAQFRDRLLASTSAAHRTGMFGLADASGVLLEYTAAAAVTTSLAATEPPEWILAALDFTALAQVFAAAPDDATAAESLLACLQHEAWPRPLEEAELEALRSGLGLPSAARNDDVSNPLLSMQVERAATARNSSSDGLQLPSHQRIDPEHLALLASEFPAMLAAMRVDLDAAGNNAAALEACADVFERGANAVDAAGLVALRHVLAHVAQRVRDAAPSLSSSQHAWLADFPQRVRAYLAAPMDPSAAGALIESLFESGDWMVLPPATAAELEYALHQVVLAADTSAPIRETQATPEQVSLAIPSDINPELLDGLLSELPVQSADFAAAMQRVASGSASMFDLDVAKRAAHTLKGAANTVGVAGIANLTHHVEDILIALTKHGRMPRRDLAEALISVADCLEAMSEAVLGAGPAPHDAQQTLQQVLDWANRIERDGLPGEDLARSDVGSAEETTASVQANAPMAQGAPATDSQAQGAAPEATLRLPAGLVDELLRLVGETMIANTQIKEQLRLTVEHTRAVTKQNSALQELAGELEQLVDVRGVTTPLGSATGSSDFDALEFDHFNELHTVTRRLMEAATDSRELSLASEQRLGTLADLLDGQGRLAVENQNVVMKTRMVPAASLVSRLQRSVRQTARLLDKRVDLHVSGEHTAIDSQVLYGLVDPLMHLLRNAVDHGIEDAELRATRSKPAVGRIELAFAREGASVLVRVRDDGGGLDIAGIRAKAERRGDLPAGQPASDDEIARFILLPGFSTRDDTTQISGRGIGMDAVHTRVQALKGTLRLHNAPSHGLTVELRLPASLMTTHGLLIRQHDQVLAVSSYGIHDIRYVTRDQVRALGNGFVYQNEGKVYELDRLDTLIGRTPHSDVRDWFPALLVTTDSGALRAVRVQDVLDSQEIVVKNLGRYVPRPHGVVGVTILGDGSIAPVLDLPQLLRAPQRAAQVAATVFTAGATLRSPVEGRRTALVVDDSLSARRAAAQFMRDAGFNVRTAIDGIEAAALLEKQVPDIVLVDMEMPRMNGLEFTTHVRTREATRHVPIIMITSRSTEKHRRQAESAGVNVYLTKPFSDDELLDHVERLTAAAAA